MKRILALILAILIVLGTFAACNSEEPKDTEKQTESVTNKNGETVKPETDKSNENSETEKETEYKPSQGLAFKLSEDGKSYFVKGIGTCTDKKIVIPEVYKNLPVTSIGEYAFYNCRSLTSVTIPDSVTSIGEKSFWFCSNLSSMTIPDSVTSIGYSAFWGCTNLTSVIIGNSVTSIGLDAFENCLKLIEVINKSSLNIEKGDVDGDNSRDSNEVAYYALEVHNKESKIVNKDGYLFYTYEGVNYLVNYIGTDTELILPANYNGENYVINKYAFFDNDNITSVIIPNSVTSIGEYAFSCCYKLVEVINKSSLNIEKGSDSNGKVAYYAFEIHNGESKIVNKHGYLFYTYEGVNYLLGYVGTDTELTLPVNYNGENYVIYQYAFYKNDNITSVTIPDSVTSIGEESFMLCSNLSSMTIPDSITSIGDSAFRDCDSLMSVTIGDSVTSIGDYAFSSCYKLVEVINKSSLNIEKGDVDGDDFQDSNEHAYYAFEVHNGESKIVNKNGYLFYTYESVNYLVNYIGTDTALTLPANYNGENYVINRYAFYYDNITSVTIPGSVTSIGSYAFIGCSNLTSVTIPDSVTSIGDKAFYDCDSLTSMTIGNNVKSLGDSSFAGCSSLTSVMIPDSVRSIGKEAFNGCSDLTNVTIGDSVTNIGEAAFIYCDTLINVTIGKNVKTIDRAAFKYCTSLTNIIIPDSVTTIGKETFLGCSVLTKVTIGNGLTNIGECAFQSCNSITNIEVNIDNSVYKSIEGNLYSKDGKILINYATGKNTTFFTIPDGVENIYDHAFFDCDSLKIVMIPDSVTIISDRAFDGCDNLTNITIGTSVTSIGNYAFNSCNNLTSVTIPDSVTNIGKVAFDDCNSLTNIKYRGTKAQWEAISKGSFAIDYRTCSITYNYTGE